MSRIEDFKSRMNDLKQYKNTTGKGYWDWKAQQFVVGGEVKDNNSLNKFNNEDIKSYQFGGEDTTTYTDNRTDNSIMEQNPIDDETRRMLLERSRQSKKFIDTYKNNAADKYKDSLKNEEIKREVNLVMDAMNRQLDTKELSKSVQKAQQKQELEKIEKVYPYKLMLNSLATLGELGSAAYMLGKGAKALGIINNFGTDAGQIAANTIGALSDGYQLITADNNRDKIENAIELPADVAGIIGGTNWLRRTRLFGRYGNQIDDVLDWMGYTAAGYDGIVKPIWEFFDFLNTKDKVEQ